MRNVVKVVMMMLILTMMLNGAAPVVENDDKPAKGDWDFQMEKEWTVSTAGEDVLVHPASLNFDEAGNLYLLDHKHGKVFAFDPAGKHLHTFGKKGEGP
ncbi:MAG: hypothetical protein GY757_60785 [bacterium]|nr:hypothetical protein [bacterium]